MAFAARSGLFGMAGKAIAGEKKKPVDVRKPLPSLAQRAGRSSLISERNK